VTPEVYALIAASAFCGGFFGVRVRLPMKVKAELVGLARTIGSELVRAHADDCAGRAVKE
jgi:hypothetical protein